MQIEMAELVKTTNENVETHRQRNADLESTTKILEQRIETLREDVNDKEAARELANNDLDHYKRKWSTALTKQMSLETQNKQLQEANKQLMKENREMHNKYQTDQRDMKEIEERIERIEGCDLEATDSDNEEIKRLNEQKTLYQAQLIS